MTRNSFNVSSKAYADQVASVDRLKTALRDIQDRIDGGYSGTEAIARIVLAALNHPGG